jgi:hypothetical protein
VEGLISGLSALVNQLVKNDAEEQTRIVDEEAKEQMKVFEKGVNYQQETLEYGVKKQREIIEDSEKNQWEIVEYGERVRQSIFEKYLDERRDKLEEDYNYKKELIDKEMNDRLFAAGLIEAKTEEQYVAAVEAARRSGDEVKIYEAEQAAEKFRIEEEAKAALLALEVQEKADKLALDEQDAADRLLFDEQIAAEKLALETETNRKKAEIQYKAEMVDWGFKLAAALASAAQAIITAWTGGAFAGPVLAGIATAATGLQSAAVIAAKPTMPAFATGGIVPGNSYSGDHKIARVNSGEGIFTQDQMRAMGLMVNSATNTGGAMNVTVIIQLDTIEIGKQTFAAANNGQYFLKARAVR